MRTPKLHSRLWMAPAAALILCALAMPVLAMSERTPTQPPASAESPAPRAIAKDGCMVGGCSGEACTETGEAVATICIWSDAFACYPKHGVCERQPGGKCGWRQTPELADCIAKASRSGSPASPVAQ